MCIFLLYCKTHKGYKCFDPVSQKYFISIDITFVETISYFPDHGLRLENDLFQSEFVPLHVVILFYFYRKQQ